MEIIGYEGLYLVKSKGDYIGGQYDSELSASYAIEKLDARLAEELWSKKVSGQNESIKKHISVEDIDSYLLEAYMT
ncbi:MULTISPECIES: hypothetical protein [Klebsiella]|uniref:hypothetical protein n=1 Tax=Klebsiella TaxID=570 RepID=UPI0002C41EDB|nr:MULTISPECIES: hypothetical protein [Klebsiella]AHI37354.1 hypothetical protein Kpn2146_3989 [Klebsiella pneumoniae]APR47307.1 hypothetical protein AM428_11535 [Klebsiella pneumoniae]EMR20386.1 hypothetical protein G000_15759 [Klebsiella pneumoniae ATCC BAA-2146]MCA4098490.1 hypothetical protein [Klebsiella pneumoniae]MCZ7366322.1 hypothetical protein [Klebsiella pneumoniae]